MKVDNGNTRLLCEICSKLNDVTESRTMLAERRHVRSRSGILIGSFENMYNYCVSDYFEQVIANR